MRLSIRELFQYSACLVITGAISYLEEAFLEFIISMFLKENQVSCKYWELVSVVCVGVSLNTVSKNP